MRLSVATAIRVAAAVRVVAAARVAAAAALMACANLGSPPGGPVRVEPPLLRATSPDSGDTNVTARTIVFEFDAVVSDRDIESFFLLSPRDGEPSVRWRRNRVEVRPGRALRPNTAYTVTMLPGITDLNNNRMPEGRTIIFSTGATIPRLTIEGHVYDWMAERLAPGARVEAIRLSDSLPYVGVADSSGRFVLGPLDEGAYLVRATLDANRNRAADPGEPTDSTSVTVRGGAPVVELLALVRDTLPPRLLTVTVQDSVTLAANFDRPLDPAQPFDSALRVLRQDSTPLRIASVQTRVQRDSVARARADSVAAARAARDTTPRDTVARPAPPPVTPARPTVDPRVERLNQQLPGASGAPRRPSRRAPPQELTITLDASTPLLPRTSYRVTATGIRGVNGRTRSSDRLIQGPAARDTTGREPAPPSRPPR